MSFVCQGVGVRIGARALLHGISVVMAPGRVTAILGPNGAGKSTLLSVLAGLRAPSTGQILLDDQLLGRDAARQLATRRAVVQQENAVAFDFRAREVVELGCYPHRHVHGRDDAAIVAQAMQSTGVGHLAERTFQTLSGGEKARVQMARALAQIWEPAAGGAARWLLLDEPTAALDLAHQHQTLRLAQTWAHQLRVGIVVVLHDLNLALRYADDAVVLSGGAVRAQGPVASTLHAELIAQVWDIGCEPANGAEGASGPVQYLFKQPATAAVG